METSNLLALIKVAECKSFSLAAQQLHISQPAISKRIKQLEDQLNSKLINRAGKQIVLTQTGLALLPRARQIINDIQSAKQLVTDLEGSPQGALRIATSHHIGLHRLPPVLRSFNHQYPDVNLDLNFMDSEQACQLIIHNEMELAIVTLPFAPNESLQLIPVWDDQLRVVCANEHPLRQLNPLNISDLIRYDAILPSDETFTREAINKALESVRGSLKVTMETNYLETIKMMVSVGLGWSILPESMIDNTIQLLTLQEFTSKRQLGIVLNKNLKHSMAVKAMVKLLSSDSPLTL